MIISGDKQKTKHFNQCNIHVSTPQKEGINYYYRILMEHHICDNIQLVSKAIKKYGGKR